MAELNQAALRITEAIIRTNTVCMPSKPWTPLSLNAAVVSLKGSVKTDFSGSVLRLTKGFFKGKCRDVLLAPVLLLKMLA